ncbi:MAG: LytTR family DNA-binding domain-containing protein [Oscillospiraceae bacterium]
MRLAICNDSKIFRDELQEDLLNYFQSKDIEAECVHFESGKELLMQKEQFNIIFMGFHMNGPDGLETARQLRKNGSTAAIIFTTSFTEIVFDTFDVDAFRFLPKPVDKGKLFKALDAYIERPESNLILIKSGRSIYRIDVLDIIYVQNADEYAIIHLAYYTIKSAQTLSEIEKLLPNYLFYRCHKSFIVGYRHIQCYNNDSILFYNGEKAFISKRRLSAFKDAFMNYHN